MSAGDSLSPRQFFHVTTETALDSIREHGLDNTLAEVGPWDNVDDWDEGAYLWDSEDRATEYSGQLSEMGMQPRILRVSGEGLGVTPDETGAEKVAGAWYTPRVPPQNIQWDD